MYSEHFRVCTDYSHMGGDLFMYKEILALSDLFRRLVANLRHSFCAIGFVSLIIYLLFTTKKEHFACGFVVNI